jgi:AmiR/NasT family two-component response regulator
MIINQSVTELEIIARELRKAGVFVCGAACEVHGAASAAVRTHPDVILIDDESEAFDGVELASELGRVSPYSALMLVTRGLTAARQVKAAKAGVTAVLPKPLDTDRLVQLLSKLQPALVA